MHNNRRSPFLAQLTLLAYLTTSLVGLQEAVLCFGVDGHIAVELASATGSCQAAPVSTRPPSAPAWMDAARLSLDHCGPCVDVNLSSTNSIAARLSALQDEILRTTPPVLLVSPVLLAPAHPAVPPRPLPLLHPVPPVAVLHGLILLI